MWPTLSYLPKSLAYALAKFIGRLDWAADFYLAPLRVMKWRGVFAVCFPEMPPTQIDRMGLRSARLRALDTLDAYRLAKLKPSDIQSQYAVNGLEHLQAAKRKGRGVVLAIAHYDRFFAFAPGFSGIGEPFSMLTTSIDQTNPEYADPVDFRYWARKMKDTLRYSKGSWITTKDSLREVYRLLGQGQTVLVALDGNESKGARTAYPFFSTELSLPQGMVRLLEFTKASAVYASVHSHAIYPWHVEIRIRPLSALPEEAMRQAVGYLENDLRQDPSAWWQWRSLQAFTEHQQSQPLGARTARFRSQE